MCFTIWQYGRPWLRAVKAAQGEFLICIFVALHFSCFCTWKYGSWLIRLPESKVTELEERRIPPGKDVSRCGKPLLLSLPRLILFSITPAGGHVENSMWTAVHYTGMPLVNRKHVYAYMTAMFLGFVMVVTVAGKRKAIWFKAGKKAAPVYISLIQVNSCFCVQWNEQPRHRHPPPPILQMVVYPKTHHQLPSSVTLIHKGSTSNIPTHG